MTTGSTQWYPVTIHNYKWVDDAGKVHILNRTEIKVYDKFPEGRCDEASKEGSWEASDGGSDEGSDRHESLPQSLPKAEPESSHQSGFKVSQSVSESASEADASAALLTEKEENPLDPYSELSDRSQAILGHLYPRYNPEYSSVSHLIPQLEEVATALTMSGWEDFFRWNRTHKPAPLVYRSLDKFLEGVLYSLNDHAVHDPQECPKCKRLGVAEKIARCTQCGREDGSSDRFGMCPTCWDAANEQGSRVVKEQMAQAAIASDRGRNPGSHVKNPSCSHCKGSTYGNPTYEDGKPYCGDCMKLPSYRRHSEERDILGKGSI